MSHSADHGSEAGRGPDDPHLVPALLLLLDRIEAVAREEITALAAGRTTEIDALVSRKGHLLVELMRLMKTCHATPGEDALAERLGSLSRTLDRNARTLSRHIDAVREVLGIVTDVIAASSDDGTYSGRVGKAAGVA